MGPQDNRRRQNHGAMAAAPTFVSLFWLFNIAVNIGLIKYFSLDINTRYTPKRLCPYGWEPKSSGYGRRLVFQRFYVRIPTQYTRWSFLHIYFCNNCNVCLKRHKINEKEAGKAHLKRLCPYEGKLSNDGCIIKHN